MAPAEAPEAAPAPPPGEVEVVPLTSIRKTIARRLTEAWQAPVFQISMSADMSRALALRQQLVELAKDGPSRRSRTSSRRSPRLRACATGG